MQLEGNEMPISSKDLLHDEVASTVETTNEVETELSIHPDWKLPQEDIYSFQFLNIECSPLLPNQLSISGIKIEEPENNEGSWKRPYLFAIAWIKPLS